MGSGTPVHCLTGLLVRLMDGAEQRPQRGKGFVEQGETKISGAKMKDFRPQLKFSSKNFSLFAWT